MPTVEFLALVAITAVLGFCFFCPPPPPRNVLVPSIYREGLDILTFPTATGAILATTGFLCAMCHIHLRSCFWSRMLPQGF